MDIEAYENGVHGAVTRKDLNIQEDAFVVGMVGRMSPQKAPDVFVKMAKKVKDAVPNAHFIIVGNGNQEGKIRRYAECNGFSDNLYITGWVDNPMSYVELFDVACLLSRWEGFGLALPEYMMVGKPIVASKVDAIPSIIRNEENGLLVEVDDVVGASKGKKLFANIKNCFKYCEVSSDDVVQNVTEMVESPTFHSKRAEFFSEFRILEMPQLIQKYFPITLKLELKKYVRLFFYFLFYNITLSTVRQSCALAISFFALSYGSFAEANNNVTETELGYINPLAVRSNYPESKRLCENMCVAFWSEYGVPVKIARLSQTFGAGILSGENRVFAQFARSAIEGKDIVLHTRGLSEGNYCYTRDTIMGLFLILIKGENAEAYNVTNPETHTTIVDMARMVCQKFGNGKIKVVLQPFYGVVIVL